MADIALPRMVLVIRHGEKPGSVDDDEKGGPHLSICGSARAAALPSLFIPGDQPAMGSEGLCCATSASPGSSDRFVGSYPSGDAPAVPSRFPTPHFLFATRSSSNSSRPLETITPLAAALKSLNDPSIDPTIDSDFDNESEAIEKLAAHVVKKPKYAGKVVLICWHHGTIPELVEDFGVPKGDLKGWDPFPSSVFDVVMRISWSTGQARMVADSERLLFGDHA
jgi:hypothetical protein